MSENLFNDGWRDPGDDAHRMVFYVSWALGFFGGLFVTIYFAILCFRHETVGIDTFPGEPAVDAKLPYLFLLFGALTSVRTGLKLYPEIKRWRKQRVSADAIVAGAFLTGAVLLWVGLERMLWVAGSAARTGTVAMLGGAVLVITFLVGIGFAVVPKLKAIPRTVEGVLVEGRYAIDHRLMEIEDHPDPVGEGCVPMVKLRMKDGRQITLRATEASYELASPGSMGMAKIAANRLREFKPSRARDRYAVGTPAGERSTRLPDS